MNRGSAVWPVVKLAGLTLVFALTSTIACANDKLQYAPAASWVKGVDLPKPNKANEGAPGQILLQNMQLNFSADGSTTYYTEFAIHIQTPAGLQAAQAFVVWNPDTDEATVHKLQILRGDQVIDVLAKGQTFTTLRREQNLDRAMLDGYLTGVVQPEGMQVGDTMVFASSIKRRDPAMGGNVEAVLPGLSSSQIVKQSINATWPASQSMRWRQSDDLRGKVSKTDNTETYTLERSNVAIKPLQQDVPARFNQFGLIEFSQFTSWQDISRVLAAPYAKAASLSPDSSLQKEIARIRVASGDPKTQAALALQLVENQVRYVFLGMNLGGYIPADAETTWQRRFGDCKGKTTLLIALLKELGIKAEPALVNSGGGDGLDQRLPSFELFDHVIVRAEIGGEVYWMDATRFGDNNLDSLPTPPLRWALPIRSDGANLEALPAKPLSKPTFDTFLRLDASAGLDVTAPAHAETVLRGDHATQFNMAFTAIPAGDRDKALRAYWSEQYSWIEPRKASAQFDMATGEERLTMDGAAKMEWLESDDGSSWRYQADIMGVGWSYAVDRPTGVKRDIPVVINFPYYQRTREEIVLPKSGEGFTTEGKDIDKTAGGSEFKRTISIRNGVVYLDSSKRALVPEISYADAKSVSDDLTEMWNEEVILVAPKRYRKSTTAKAKAGADTSGAQPAKSIDELLDESKALVNDKKTDEALAVFNKVLRLDDKNVMALQGRAYIFLMRGNYTAAAADFELASKIDPTQWTTLNGLGAVRMAQARQDDAIAAFSAALDIYPNDVYALLNRAHVYLSQKKIELARQDANTVNDLDGASDGLTMLRVNIELVDKKPEAAKDILRQALIATPDDVLLHSLMANLLINCQGLDDKACAASKALAVAEYDAMIALEPTADAYAMRAQSRPKADRALKLADFDAAIKADPTSNAPFLVRAPMWIEEKAYDKALADVNAAIPLDPTDMQPYVTRAIIHFKMNDTAAALADLDTLKHKFPQDAWVYNISCWDRATNNIELDAALADCNTAVKMAPQNAAFLDSRGFVQLRLGHLDEALADYNAALVLEPQLSASLYGRGLVKLRKGDKSGGKADLDAARKLVVKIDEEFAEYGLKP